MSGLVSRQYVKEMTIFCCGQPGYETEGMCTISMYLITFIVCSLLNLPLKLHVHGPIPRPLVSFPDHPVPCSDLWSHSQTSVYDLTVPLQLDGEHSRQSVDGEFLLGSCHLLTTERDVKSEKGRGGREGEREEREGKERGWKGGREGRERERERERGGGSEEGRGVREGGRGVRRGGKGGRKGGK